MRQRRQDLHCRAHDIFMDLLCLPGDIHPLEVARAMSVCAHIMHVSSVTQSGMATPIWDELLDDCKKALHRRVRELLDTVPEESEDSQ